MEIAIDFDGTCVTHDFPYIGKEIGSVPVLKRLVENGHRLILFTMRSDIVYNDPNKKDELYLKDAINWFNNNEIELYGINTNPTQKNWTNSPKAYAALYIDDAALGCPLKHDLNISEKPFVDWNIVENYLTEMNLI